MKKSSTSVSASDGRLSLLRLPLLLLLLLLLGAARVRRTRR
jgi:hypothetical protein